MAIERYLTHRAGAARLLQEANVPHGVVDLAGWSSAGQRDINRSTTAVNEPAARAAFQAMAGKCGDRYPAIVSLSDNAWAEFLKEDSEGTTQ